MWLKFNFQIAGKKKIVFQFLFFASEVKNPNLTSKTVNTQYVNSYSVHILVRKNYFVHWVSEFWMFWRTFVCRVFKRVLLVCIAWSFMAISSMVNWHALLDTPNCTRTRYQTDYVSSHPLWFLESIRLNYINLFSTYHKVASTRSTSCSVTCLFFINNAYNFFSNFHIRHHVWSGSPWNFQISDSPETRLSPLMQDLSSKFGCRVLSVQVKLICPVRSSPNFILALFTNLSGILNTPINRFCLIH